MDERKEKSAVGRRNLLSSDTGLLNPHSCLNLKIENYKILNSTNYESRSKKNTYCG